MSARGILLTFLPIELIFLTVALFVLNPIRPIRVSASGTAALIDCKEFVDQAEAQRFFEVKGGPTLDPYHLDGDGDGIACEPGPSPTPVSQSHADECQSALDAAGDSNGSSVGGRFQTDCADWLEQTGQLRLCPAYEGLSYRYFSSLTQDQVSHLTDVQKSEYDDLMKMSEGECVPVDVARTSAWQCQTLPYYLGEFQKAVGLPITNYYQDQLTKRYQVVCLGAPNHLGESRKFSMLQLIGAAIVGAGAVYLYGRHRKNRKTVATSSEG